MKGKRVSDVYVDPLPYTLGPLPNLVLHNPLSVAHFLWVYFMGRHPEQVRITAEYSAQGGVFVSDPEHMQRLWSMGFFGKGTLSRSEPSWFGRTARRLGLDGGELTFEEITELRRKKRRQFKKQRGLQEQRDLQEKLRLEGKEFKEIIEDQDDDESEPETPVLPQETALVVDDASAFEGKTIKRIEKLQLMPCETLYLSIGLGVLDVYSQDKKMETRDLVDAFCGDPKLLLQYITYHYLRSLGWCVRSGVKFGTDFIVYKQGPPFQHAQFAVMIMRPDEQPDWWWSQSVSRVVGAVRKSLVFCYIDGPNPADLDLSGIESINGFRKLLKEYSVRSVIYSRWAPTKTRD